MVNFETPQSWLEKVEFEASVVQYRENAAPGRQCRLRFVSPVRNQYVNDLGYFVSVDGGVRQSFCIWKWK